MQSLCPGDNPKHITPTPCPGFALLDILIAMTLLAAGFISLVGLQGKLLSIHGDNQTLGEAMVLTKSKLERLRYLIRHDMTKMVHTENLENQRGSSVLFDLQWSISERADLRYYSASVSTLWQRGNRKRTLTLEGTTATLETMPNILLLTSTDHDTNQ